MLKKAALFFLILLVSGCNDTSKINFGRLQISNKEEVNAPLVIIDVPKAIKQVKLAKEINKAIEEKIMPMLVFDETVKIETIDNAIHSFKRNFYDIKDKFPKESAVRWEAKINGNVLFETKKVLTIVLESYIFTGGAHGYESISFLNFDKKKGKQLEIEDLVRDSVAFVRYAEDKFRLQEKISMDVSINDTGFMFKGEEFQLSDNIGYTKDGLQLLYNVYEIASYTDGTIKLILPYDEVNTFLKLKVE